MDRPYTYRIRSELGPKIRAMKEGDILLLSGYAAGSVKSVVCRHKLTKPKGVLRFKTHKTSAGIIVTRFDDGKRTYQRRKPNGLI